MLPLKGFKKVAEDQHTAVLEHDKGHQIRIAKASLTKSLARQLSTLPLHQSDPKSEIGDVPQEDTVSPQLTGNPDVPRLEDRAFRDKAAKEVAQDKEYAEVNKVIGTEASPQTETQAGVQGSLQLPVGNAVAPQTTPQAPPPASNVPQQPTNPLDEALKGVPGATEDIAAANLAAKTAKERGAAEAILYKSEADAARKGAEEFSSKASSFQSEQNALMQDLQNSHIKPNDYMENMSTPAKISTAIGLILGGIGGAKTGQANPAAVWLDKQIDRNIDAQKANMGKKQNLLAALHQQYGDMVVAENMHRAFQANALANDIASTQSKFQGPMADAARLQAISGVKQRAAQYMQSAVLFSMQNDIEKQPQGANLDARAQSFLQVARRVNPKVAEEFEKRYVPGVGVAKVPLEPRDRDKLIKQSELHNLLSRANTYMEDSGTLGHPFPGATRAEGQSLQQQINLKMGELADLTRFTPEENKIYRQTVPDLVGTHITGRDKALLKGIIDTNSDALNTFYKQKGINTSVEAPQEPAVRGQDGKMYRKSPDGKYMVPVR